MYIENLRSEFYDVITGKHIFVVINYDIDSVCACKIFQAILRHTQTLYSIAVINNVDDLKITYQENCSNVKHFVFVNCGGSIDIVEVLQPEEDIVFFVLDSHRPTDLCNIYSNGQIRLMWTAEEDADVPEFHDVFREDESEDELQLSEGDDDDEDESRASKRQRFNEEQIMKRRERRLWEEKRNKLVFDYSQFTYYSRASSVAMFKLAWKLSQDDKDLLWYAIVGLTEQMLLGKIENSVYVLECGELQAHSVRLHNRSNDAGVSTALKISFEKDLQLALYRHWSIECSLKFSMFTACKLKLWSIRGDKRLQELLVDMGLPLAQSRQNYRSMDLLFRQEFQSSLEKMSEKYGLEDISYVTFSLTYGYNNRYSATDVVYAMLSALEAGSADLSRDERFHDCLDCLSRNHKEVLVSHIEKAKHIVTGLFKTVQSALEMKKILSAGPFLYFIVQESCPDYRLFSHQQILLLLAHFVLKAYVAVSRNRKATTLPLLVSAPKDLERGTCIVLGIPPLCENSPKNFFGKAFEQVAEKIKCDWWSSSLDTAYIEVRTSERTRFLDALTALLG